MAHSSSGGISGKHGFGGATCADCHTSAAYSAAGGLDWTNGSNGAEATSIVVGITTPFGLKLNTLLSPGIGFNAAARKDSNDAHFGAFSSVTGDQKIISGNEITHVTQTASATEWKWSFTADEVAPFKFYSCVNQVNNNGNSGGDGSPVCGTLSVTVTNTIPTPTNDSGGVLTVNEGNEAFSNFDVFANDGTTDADTHSISFREFGSLPANVSNPSGSLISFSPSSSTYDSLAAGESQNVTFTYKIQDAYSVSANGSVTITINGVNDAPVITQGAGPITQTISEDNSPTAFSLTLNATDADASDTITWSISSAASNGTASVSGTGASKAISYAPTTDYNGADSFTVQVSDGTATDAIVVSLTIDPVDDLVNLVIDSTGYLTPYLVVPPTPSLVAAGATSVSGAALETVNGKLAVVGIAASPATNPKTIAVDASSTYRPGHHDIVWTASDSSGVLGTLTQSLNIRPIVSSSADQQAVEGNTVTVVVMLNGLAATYPVTINYTVSGTADTSDHTAVSGSFQFADTKEMASFQFDVKTDALDEDLETVIFTITSATNAAIGNDKTHVVSVVKGNIAPVVSLQLKQAGKEVSSAYVSNGTVTVNAVVSDVNSAQTHTYDWSMTSNSLSPPTDSTSSSWTFESVVGNYVVDLNSTDNGSPVLSNRVSRILSVLTTAPTLDTKNSDGEGADDITEGFGDSDADGIPDYLDAQSSGAADQHLIPNQTVDGKTRFLVQTEPGIKIVTGNTARASNNHGVTITDANIGSFGSLLGGVPLNATDDFEHVGGIYDFELSGLTFGQSVNIAFPLESAIPINGTFRKFNPSTGWSGFVVDSSNRLASAPGVLGACPEPGSSQYVDGLVAFSNCLQLTVQDGGPNDADGVVNGVVKDPGSVSITVQDATTPVVRGSGGGRIDLTLLLGLFLLIWFRACAYNRVRCR